MNPRYTTMLRSGHMYIMCRTMSRSTYKHIYIIMAVKRGWHFINACTLVAIIMTVKRDGM